MGESYPYEDLDGRRFQRLVQSLITAERPRAQCLPISGPDGGRDSVVLDLDDDNTFIDAIVYQVKFREPNPLGTPTADDLYKWVTKNLKGEIPKLQALKGRGAREFVFVSNVPASGHLDSGLRDRVQGWAKNHLPLPTFFWWREDVDARLDRHPSLVFRFTLFRGPDAVHSYLTETLTKNTAAPPSQHVSYTSRNPAVSTILLYLSRQYDEQASLRFKQAHVDAPLIESFVDVPLAISPDSTARHQLSHKVAALAEQLHETEEEPGEDYEVFLEELYEERDRYPLGAASALLTDHDIPKLDRLVIEAGPGQGKSTLIQFIGQVLRARLLNKESDLARLPARLVNGPLRMPLRVELRHLGKWMQGISPWLGSEEPKARTGAPSLQSYIADHVQFVTGGMRFSNDDLVAVVSSTPTLLLLDGLDEVADPSLRDQVVKTVSSFVQDMESLGSDVQVVATGRPSSLASAPTFSRDVFLYGKLEDLTVDLTERYANSWISRRTLPTDQASELRGALAGCLTQPHVAELARTPMQLAILLWLVHTRGWNLPDKRTSLYDEYINTLLDREADKTPVVRKYREVLLEVHGYLGWLLHARSQEKSGEYGAGDIESAELKRTIWSYLDAKEGPSDRIKEITEGINRVFVLVERIEGKFEFQVQPLREFFAARYLYKTARYHTNAVEVTGSRPERLEALIRDAHWLNVARFFCGWYDIGELADLTQRIGELWGDDSHRYSLHSRLLVAYLLNDYVSAAAPKCTRQIAGHLTDMLSMRQILRAQKAGVYQPPSSAEFVPTDSGLPVLLDAAKAHYTEPISDEIVYELAPLLLQLPNSERSKWWLHNLQDSGVERDEWIRRGVIANCLVEAARDDLLPLFEETSTTLQWVRCVEAGRMDIASTGGRMRRFIDALARGYSPLFQNNSNLGEYLTYLTRNIFRTGFYDPRVLHKEVGSVPQLNFDGDSAALEELRRLSDLMVRCHDQKRARTSLTERANLIGEEMGDPWVAWRLALSTAPWKGCSGYPTINDRRVPLSERAAALWKHREQSSLWHDAFRACMHDGHKMAVSAALLSWAPGHVIVDLSNELNELCRQLEPWEFSQIRRFVGVMNAPTGLFRLERKTRIREGELKSIDENASCCLLAILEHRMGPNAIWELGEIIDSRQACGKHAGFISGFLVNRALKRMAARRDWGDALEICSAKYQNARSDALHSKGISPQGWKLIRSRMDANTAKRILAHPHEFPVNLLTIAEEGLERSNLTRPTLYEIAQGRRWFEHQL
ncbi:NACHT domain-containing protein [Streptomyces sp. NPDC001292]|uniref:NACHT domain-containing protein n=1 Tax=Streptomyces sp. NPDC001292 TaxID=3364558 RepID=UPI0036AE9B8B